MLTRIELHFQVRPAQTCPTAIVLSLSKLWSFIPVKLSPISPSRSVSFLECLHCEIDWQAEKSARLEAAARCAAAMEALRRVGHPHSMPLLPPPPRQLPESVIDRARDGITAACSLVASVSSVLEGQPALPKLSLVRGGNVNKLEWILPPYVQCRPSATTQLRDLACV